MHADEFTRPPTTLINARGRVNSAGQVAITPAACGVCNYWRQAKINLEMAKKLPSNPDFLLKLLDDLPSDGSDDDFDGYVTDSDDQDDQQVQDVFTRTDAFTDGN